MQKIPAISTSEYSYDLPDERIAVYPLPQRDGSKLLIYRDGEISETLFADIDRILPKGSLLITNNTRVIHARLLFYRLTGARIEIFCLEPWRPSDYQLSFQQQRNVEWRCLVGNAKKWKQGILEQIVDFQGKKIKLKAEMAGKDEQGFIIRFSWDSDESFASVVDAAGMIPIPPYLNRPSEEDDNFRYQTLYAKIDGSVAAPTAGLHFTERLLSKLAQKDIKRAELTLHVGAGTFQPVKSGNIAGHTMHTETVVITKDFIHKLLEHKGKVIAVGTTSVRSLESLYWLGLKIPILTSTQKLHVSQWEPYQITDVLKPRETLQNIYGLMIQNHLTHLTFTTSIIIVPGYYFRMTGGMITNFHQSRSTLLLLIAAFLGPDWRKVYDYALENGFRFLSYGDSNLYLRDGENGNR